MDSKTRLVLGLLLSAFLLAPVWGQSVPLHYELVVKPIFVQDPGSGNIAVQTNYAASLALFEEATQRVYAQAGIRIVWATSSVYVASSASYYTLGTDNQTASINMGDLTQTAGHGQSTTPNTLNLWFTGPNGNTLGVSEQSRNVGTGGFTPEAIYFNGATVSESVFGPQYSLTTLPHELGHVLGLDHNVISAGTPKPTYNLSGPLVTGGNLMATGYGATTLSAITTDGVSGFGILTQPQIDMLLLSPYVHANPDSSDTYNYSAIPEPSSSVLIAGLLTGLGVVGYRRKITRRTTCQESLQNQPGGSAAKTGG